MTELDKKKYYLEKRRYILEKNRLEQEGILGAESIANAKTQLDNNFIKQGYSFQETAKISFIVGLVAYFSKSTYILSVSILLFSLLLSLISSFLLIYDNTEKKYKICMFEKLTKSFNN